MIHVEIDEPVAAPAEAVWDCYVGSRAEELVVSLFAERFAMEGEGPGAVRTTWLPDGSAIVERIESIDHDRLTCTYTVVDSGPFPFADYRGRIAIERDGADSCIVRLAADFTATGMTDEDAADQYRQHNLAGIAQIRELLGAPG